MSEKDVEKNKQESQQSGFTENQIYVKSSAALESKSPPIWIWVSVAGLLLAALLVIFVLPALVTEYELPLELRVDVTEFQPLPAETVPTISPFEEAQLSRQRKEAQDVLAELLTQQEVLELIDVEQWAQDEYTAALEVASIGDEYYRTQDFQLATESYTQGRDDLVEIQAMVPVVLNQNLVDAQSALDAQDSFVAQNKFLLALLLDPDSEVAQIGLERARVLDEVSGLLAEADSLLEDNELEAAQVIYRQIVSLDSYSQDAQQRISEVAGLILQREFSFIMSSGYAFLESDNPDQAIAEFERAASLGINQEQARAAIAQTENVIDANLVFAINGRDYASKRAQLDDLLVSAIETPDRFYEQDVFQQTLDVYYTGRAIETPGARISEQLQKLQLLLETSQVPLDIQMVSDNLTDVTILRIGNLGLFEQTVVSLKPGRYVAIGKRIGYREVREEFVVGFNQTPDSVLVQCVERVVATNR